MRLARGARTGHPVPVSLSCASLLVAFLVLGSGPAAAAEVPDAATLQAAWRAARPALEAHVRGSVELDQGDFETLAAGDVARHRQRLDGADRAVGAVWTDLPRAQLWVAILDDTCFTLADGLTELHLPSSDPLVKLLFQHVAVPWPFVDRQWILEIRSNRSLYRRTAGRIWERGWHLADDQAGLAALVPGEDMPVDGAIWTPENDGGWVVLEAGQGNLLVYNARVDIGGAVPDGTFTSWVLGSLKKLLSTVVERARVMPQHYGPDHDPILRPDGQPIPGWP